MTDGWFLPKHEQDQLVELLGQIPALIEDLAITIAKQDRMTSGPKIANGSDEQPLPFDENAAQAADELNHELARWVRHTCEQRHLTYDGRDDTITLTAWLKRWIIALALTEGSEEALHDIRLAVRQARRAVDRPREKQIERPPDESLDAVGLTKDELREAIYARTNIRVTRKDINNWIQRGHINDLGAGHYSLTEAITYLQKRAIAA